MTKVLLICGEGEEVEKSITALSTSGADLTLVGIAGIHSLGSSRHDVHEMNPGEIGKLFEIADRFELKDLATVGSFARIKSADIVPDATAKDFLARRGYDQNELTLFQWMRVAFEIFAEKGMRLFDVAQRIALISYLPKGFATKIQWSWPEGESDFHLARRVQVALNRLQVGETVVAKDHSIVGIEAANEGTDEVLARVGRGARRSGVMVKWPYFDLNGDIASNPIPKIGLKTAELANNANLKGIVIHEKTQIWDKNKLISFLDSNEMFLYVTEENWRLRE